MAEFLTLLPPQEALQFLMDKLHATPAEEIIPAAESLGRVTSQAVIAPYALPSFRRSTVDGYAVRAGDTHGANESLPAYLKLAGEISMGAAPIFSLQPGFCGLIHTGGMLPEGADAVVMVEVTQLSLEDEVEIFKAVAAGENVLQIGEDIGAGDEVIAPGTVLRAAEIGGLMALGITQIPAVRRPRVGIISSGDEVVAPEQDLQPGQVRDVNTYTLQALVAQSGGAPRSYGIVPDNFEDMLAKFLQAKDECDLVVITAGSSASARDMTSRVIDAGGSPGVLVHGVNVRPGKPTILGLCDGIPVIGLPGNPVSALVIAGIFVVPVIHRLLGINAPLVNNQVSANLSLNLSSQAGREDWVAVRLTRLGDGYLADPVFGKSNLIFTLAKADGLICIPASANGLQAGSRVEVHLF